MEEDEENEKTKPDPRLRLVVVIILSLLVIFVTISDIGGRLFINPNFHISDLMLGSLIGALLLALGIDQAKRPRG